MPRRIDVELTSRRDDGTWTWRAAGAREPKGSVDSTLLPSDAALGMVLKAELEIDIEGIVVTAMTAPKNVRTEPQRLEIMGSRHEDEALVTSTLVRRGRDDRGPRGDRGDRPDRGPRPNRSARPDRPEGDRRPRSEGDRRPRPEGDDRRRPPFERKAPVEARPKAKRLRALRTHRNELIAQLPEEHRPIAEELFRGGIPAVRTALDKQNEVAKGEDRPVIDPAPLLTLAERLWPQVRTAEWRDRAEGALADVEELDLRDLRSVVVAGDSAARDDETRAMATQLREALNRRVDEEHTKWLVELAELVADGRVVGALRRSSRPPKAGAPLPAELAATLATQTGEALNAEVTPDRWAVLLDALSFSPVRTSVTPLSVPEARPEELLVAVRKSAARLPAIAALFGISAEAPAALVRGRRPRPAGRPAGAGAGSGRPPIPPPPPAGTPSPSATPSPAAPDTLPVPASGAPDSSVESPETASPETGSVERGPVETEPADTTATTPDPTPPAEPAATAEAIPTAPAASVEAGSNEPALAVSDGSGEPTAETEPG